MVSVPPARAEGFRARAYWLHVPHDYRSRRRIPLLLAFHGAGGTGLGMQAPTGLSSLADRHGFLVAYPQGLPSPVRGSHGYVWYSSGPLDPLTHGVDDGLYVSDLVTRIQEHYCVDPDRIAAVGISNGGGMVGYLACVLAARISAFVAIEGEFFQVAGGCRPAHPISLLEIHARDDHVAPYAGVPARASPDYYAPAVSTWLFQWALRERCARSTNVPPLGGLAGQQWSACDGRSVVAGYIRLHGGHSWPRTLGGQPGTAAVVRFALDHPLSAVPNRWFPHSPDIPPTLTAPQTHVSSITLFHVPTPGAEPYDLAVSSDGALWFTEFEGDKIGRIGRSGHIREFQVPTRDAQPFQLIALPDGSMWFTEYNTKKLGVITPTRELRETPITRQSDGGLGIAHTGTTIWVADPAGAIDRIGRGGVQSFPLPTGSGLPFAIVTTPSGDVWTSEFTGYLEHTQSLVRLKGAAVHTLALTTPSSDVDALATGPHNSLWFTDYGADQLDALTGAGALHRFHAPAPYPGLNDITLGPDGAMWFTEQSGVIGRITRAGAISELALPAGSNPDGIAAGPDHTIWIAETGADTIVRLRLH